MLFRKIAIVAVLLIWSTAAAAQNGSQMDKLAQTTPEQRAKVQTALMKEKLALTEQQLPEVAKINLDTATRMQPILEGSDRPLMKMRQAKDIETQRDASLQRVLQPAQYQQWLAQKESMRQKLEEKLMEKRAGGGAS